MIQGDPFPEIRAYLNLLRRRWYIILIPTLLATLFAVYRFGAPASYYTVGLRYLVSQPPTDETLTSDLDRRWTWVTSQYVVNSVTDWSNGTDFAYRIADEVAKNGTVIDPVSLNKNMDAFTERSKLTILINHPDEKELEQIMGATTIVLNNYNGEAIPQISNQPAIIKPIDRIDVVEVAPSIMEWLDTPIIIAFGFALGFGLALLLEYLDPRVHNPIQLTALDLRTLTVIPRE